MPPNTVSSPLTNGALHHENDKVTPMETIMNKKRRWTEFETEIRWDNTAFMVILHTISLYTFITFPYRQQLFLLVWALIVVEFAEMGISVGAHRLWTHRAYKAKLPLQIILAIAYYTAGLYKIRTFVREHRVHHKYTDTDADPHNSNRGFWFSHIGWLMLKKKPIVRKREKEIDMSDILQNPVVQFFDRYYAILRTLFAFVVPVVIPVYFFDQDLKWSIMSQLFMRYPYNLHLSFCVNSFAHMFGDRTYNKSIKPTQNIWLRVLIGGEGWHNYHHVFPWDYRASEFKSVFINAMTFWIDLFAKIGWAYDLKTTSSDHVRKVVQAQGDGTHPTYGNKKHIVK